MPQGHTRPAPRQIPGQQLVASSSVCSGVKSFKSAPAPDSSSVSPISKYFPISVLEVMKRVQYSGISTASPNVHGAARAALARVRG
jgi:hypothetical protein